MKYVFNYFVLYVQIFATNKCTCKIIRWHYVAAKLNPV